MPPWGRAESATAVPVVVDEEGEAASAARFDFTLQPWNTLSGTVPFAVPARTAAMRCGRNCCTPRQVIDRRGNVFAVADSPFRCMMRVGSDMPGPYLLAAGASLRREGVAQEEGARPVGAIRPGLPGRGGTHAAELQHLFEWFAWAREDATVMTEDSDEPYLSGQTLLPGLSQTDSPAERPDEAAGIAPVAYLNAHPFGWPGFEVVQQHREWYVNASFQHGRHGEILHT